MHPIIDAFVKDIPVRQPLTHKAVCPRRILPPNGYLNPKYFGVTLWSELRVGFDAEMTMLPHITGFVNALLQLEYRVPTYFVRSEFAQAVAQTEPPADFKFSEIQWPLPAMLFVLPNDFVLRYFGYMCPFLSVTRSAKGIYPNCLKHLPPCDDLRQPHIPFTSLHNANPLDNQVDRINIVYPVYSRNTAPVDYTGSYPLTMNVNELGNVPFHDATYMEEAHMGTEGAALFGLHSGPDANPSDLPAEGEVEKVFSLKVQNFAIKLMLALTARPNFIAHGSLQRSAKQKKGRTFDELWNPNLIGWDYRAKREGIPDNPTDDQIKSAAMQLETRHASPRMHWRRGFMRNQPYGPKNSLRHLIWIEPCLINADDDTPKTKV
jgi:hypothetical protein